MAIDERLRLNIHARFTELLGSEEADALIAHIMPVPWHDVATKDDLRVLSAELRAEFHTEIGALSAQIGGLRGELHQAIVVQTRWLMGYVTALSAVMLAVARLLF